jgi:uncharacterized DUF497 family protein
MEFEFDEIKSEMNKQKHGIDFIEAQLLWMDPERLVIPAKYISEVRYIMIAATGNVIWSAIYTLRGNKIRIISARRARQNEKELYKS